jgi:hypothetical protein
MAARDRNPESTRADTDIPDARDGLTRKERIVLFALRGAEAERNGRGVRAAMLYGRVLEHVDMSIEELMRIVERLSALRHPLLIRNAGPKDRFGDKPHRDALRSSVHAAKDRHREHEADE